MKWGKTVIEADIERSHKTGYWFAWHPVKSEDGRFVWLEKVYRVCCKYGGWDYYSSELEASQKSVKGQVTINGITGDVLFSCKWAEKFCQFHKLKEKK